MTERDIADLRTDYLLRELRRADVDSDPVAQFRAWLDEAIAAAVPEPTAMTLATVGDDGWPSARVVLLKGLDARGFAFYTNRGSHKARELDRNPRAALTFLWKELQRQVRVEGEVERVSDEESDAYFATRPRASQIGAWASRQSEVVASREVLERQEREISERFADRHVPRPEFWGGYRVRPLRIEFWQGRRSRLHDRMRYRRESDAWIVERLSP